MFLSDFSIRRPIAMVVIVIALMCMGLLALKQLRVNQFPDIEPPVLLINIPYPGASPETVEFEVINRIEKALQSISGVDQINSTAEENSAKFRITFKFGKSLIQASDEVRNAIASVRFKLPAEIREPILQRSDPSAQPIMNMALSSTKQSHAEISRIAEDILADKFRGIDGVAIVNVVGGLRRELSVLLREQKLREYNISVAEIVNALRNQNTTTAVGRVKGSLSDSSIRLVGRIESPNEFAQIVIKRRGSEVVRLGQVAEIKDGFADNNNISQRNGRINVGLDVIRSDDASMVAVANKVRDLVKEINRTLPNGTQLAITNDGGVTAERNLKNVIECLLFGAILTIVVVYVFLNSWRSTLITALSLPTSVVMAFIAVWLSGFTLNFMTLLGLSLAIGVLIDDAIVVRENIVRHMAMGADRRTAAIEGTREIGFAVAATTFAIVAVFLPVAFMPGLAGQWFRPFALTVASSVVVSLFISFTLDPMLSAYWGDPIAEHEKPKRGLGLLLSRFNDWFDRQADRYANLIAWALHHPRLMVVTAVISFIAAIALHFSFGGSSFLPVSDSGKIVIDVRMPSGANLNYARLKMERAADVAKTLPETLATDSSIDSGGGRIYVDIGSKTERKRSATEIATDLRKKLRHLIGAEYTVLDDVNMGAQKPVQIQFSGPDSRRLLEITTTYVENLRKVSGATDVGLSEQAPKNELQIVLHRGLANSLGISVNDAAVALRIAFAGIEVGDWVDPTGESRDVAVRLHPDDNVDVGSIERLPIAVSGSDVTVPLGQIATISMGKSPAKIQHVNGNRLITVSANVEGRSAGEVTADALKIAKAIDFPSGYGLRLGGASRSQAELFTEMVIALVMGIGLMYLILVMQFGSFTAPVSIMFSLPLSLIGVVISLLLTKATLNLMSLIGIIMLMGLVAKNAILLVDCARNRQSEGYGRAESLMYAGRMRLRPILMTTFALIAGMLPVAIGLGEGGEFYRPLAIAIIGGTMTSTILTLMVVPVFYDNIENARDRAVAQYQMLSDRSNSFQAFLVTFFEAVLTLLFVRFFYRLVRKFGKAISRNQ